MSGPRIAIVTAMRDEGPNLVDWVAHLRAAGADDILVFSNACGDGTDGLLDLLDAAGIVTHVRNAVPPGKTPQWSALKRAAGHPLVALADWIAVLDCDEYVNLRAPLDTLQDLVAAVDADGLVLPWRLFGHGGHASRPAASPLRAFTRAIPDDALYPPLARFFKTLYRREAFGRPGVHRPRQAGTAPRWVDGSGRALPEEVARDPGRIMLWGAPLATDLVQLNHYSVRSAAEFLAKRARGLPNHTAKPVDLAYWVERNFNSVEDRSILRMAPRTEAEADRLRLLPGLAAAERASRDWHDRHLAALLGDRANVQLLGRLLLAGGSRVPDEATTRQLVSLYRAAGRDGPDAAPWPRLTRARPDAG